MLYVVLWIRVGFQGCIFVLVFFSQRILMIRDVVLLVVYLGILWILRNWVVWWCVQCLFGYQVYDVDGGFS